MQVSTNTFTPVNVDDIPIKPQKVDYNQASIENFAEIDNTTHASIEVPKYNFEEILQKALEEQGEPMGEEQVQPAKKIDKKPKFLKRKKRYDPKEAIEKDKQKKGMFLKLIV